MDNKIDELHVIDRVSIDYKDYFGEMDLTEEEKERRIALAEEFEILFLFFFMSIKQLEMIDYQAMIYEKYIKIAMEFINQETVPYYIDVYAKKIAEEIIDVTEENIDDEYFTSKDRAMFIAENEANTIGNYNQQLQAIKSGMRYKTWITKNDRKVRHSHSKVNDETIDIFDSFDVGNYKMMFPKDASLGAKAEEIVNCRCIVKYS